MPRERPAVRQHKWGRFVRAFRSSLRSVSGALAGRLDGKPAGPGGAGGAAGVSWRAGVAWYGRICVLAGLGRVPARGFHAIFLAREVNPQAVPRVGWVRAPASPWPEQGGARDGTGRGGP